MFSSCCYLCLNFSKKTARLPRNGTWFRARDLKPGGSRTLARYDPEIYQRLEKLEFDLWRDAPATFVTWEWELVDVAPCGQKRLLSLPNKLSEWCAMYSEVHWWESFQPRAHAKPGNHRA